MDGSAVGWALAAGVRTMVGIGVGVEVGVGAGVGAVVGDGVAGAVGDGVGAASVTAMARGKAQATGSERTSERGLAATGQRRLGGGRHSLAMPGASASGRDPFASTNAPTATTMRPTMSATRAIRPVCDRRPPPPSLAVMENRRRRNGWRGMPGRLAGDRGKRHRLRPAPGSRPCARRDPQRLLDTSSASIRRATSRRQRESDSSNALRLARFLIGSGRSREVGISGSCTEDRDDPGARASAVLDLDAQVVVGIVEAPNTLSLEAEPARADDDQHDAHRCSAWSMTSAKSSPGRSRRGR